MKKETEKKDYRQELTNTVKKHIEEILNQIDEVGSWNKPWFVSKEFPFNPVTGTRYRGINTISLLSAGYPDPRFYSYNGLVEMEKQRISANNQLEKAQSDYQSQKIDLNAYRKETAKINAIFEDLENKGMEDRTKPIFLTKGSKGHSIFKAVDMVIDVDKPIKDEKGNHVKKDGQYAFEKDKETIKVMAYSGTVFNASNISNIKAEYVSQRDFEPHEEAEYHINAMVRKTGLKIEHNNLGRAFYSVANHAITMPEKDRFEPGAYYDTLLHEIGHATGPALGRDLSGKFGSKSYAFEELVAELSSLFMSYELGIPHNPSIHENHVAYLKSWLNALDKDKNLIFKAASKAQQSTDYQNNIRNEMKMEDGLIAVVKKDEVKPEEVKQVKKSVSMSM